MQQQELTTQQAKIKEERERADADAQKNTQEHQERMAAKNQEHVMNFHFQFSLLLEKNKCCMHFERKVAPEACLVRKKLRS